MKKNGNKKIRYSYLSGHEVASDESKLIEQRKLEYFKTDRQSKYSAIQKYLCNNEYRD